MYLTEHVKLNPYCGERQEPTTEHRKIQVRFRVQGTPYIAFPASPADADRFLVGIAEEPGDIEVDCFIRQQSVTFKQVDGLLTLTLWRYGETLPDANGENDTSSTQRRWQQTLTFPGVVAIYQSFVRPVPIKVSINGGPPLTFIRSSEDVLTMDEGHRCSDRSGDRELIDSYYAAIAGLVRDLGDDPEVLFNPEQPDIVAVVAGHVRACWRTPDGIDDRAAIRLALVNLGDDAPTNPVQAFLIRDIELAILTGGIVN